MTQEERLIARVFHGQTLLFTATVPVDMSCEQLTTWVEDLQARGFMCCYKRIPWPDSDESPCASWGKGGRR